MSRTRTDIQIDAAVGLLARYAVQFPEALHHIDRELRALDGYPASTMGDGMSRSTAELTTVERGADARLRLSVVRSQLVDDRDAILSLISSALAVCRDALGHREAAASGVARCHDALHGREGALEWGRPECEDLPVKAGLCSACYRRELRWRQAHDLIGREVLPVA